MKRIRIKWALLLLLAAAGGACKRSATEAAETKPVVQRLEQRIESLNRAIEKTPSDWALYQERSLLHYEAGSLDMAINDVRSAIRLYEDGPNLHYLRGFYALVQNDTGLALSEFQLAARYGATLPDNYYQMGQQYFFHQNYNQALRMYQHAARMDTLEPIYHFAQGFLEQSRGNFRQAEAHYLESLRLNPNFIKSMLHLHDLYADAYKNETRAMQFNQQVLDRDPANALARYNQGNYHYRQALKLPPESQGYKDAINQAVVEYTLAINRGAKKGFAEPFFFRGYCYLQGGRYELALADLQKAAEIDPKHADAHFYLGSLHEHYQDLQKALFHYGKALEVRPDFPEAKEAVTELRAQRR